MIKISIITVLFNPIKNGRKEMLLQAIHSVANQDYTHKEHIIIDGASTDGTVELLQMLKDSGKISHFISEPDKGIYDAMNKGARLASGDYIGFLNSDDYYSDLKAFSAIAQMVNGFDYLYSPVLIENKAGIIDGKFFPSPKRFLTKMPFAHQSLIVKKSLFEEIKGFDTQFKLASDYDFIIRMTFKQYRGILYPKPLSVFRMGGISDMDSTIGKTEKIKIWTKNYGEADYTHHINKKVLPITILLKIFKKYPNAWKNILYELYRTIRKSMI